MTAEHYRNSGLITSGHASNAEPRTIITLGAARGGTSLIAGALHHLGVFDGDACHSPVYEDCRLSDAFESRSPEQPVDVISDYNQRHEIWAWKRPGSINYLRKLNKLTRNPHYVIIFRDLLAIANRNSISMGFELDNGLRSALKTYTAVSKFIRKNKAPKLLVSYEKAVEDEERFIDTLIAFSHLDVTAEQRMSALQFVQPNSVEYLENTRADRIIGRIESVSADTVRGWSSRAQVGMGDSVKLRLLINGQAVQCAEACEPRADMHFQNKRASGNTGFVFHLDKHRALTCLDEIRVVAIENGCDIARSPWTYRPA